MNSKSSGYIFEHQWFDFARNNPDLISPGHGSMYFALMHVNNNLGWCEKFAAPASQTMALTGIASFNTYKKIFNDLVSWGFIRVVKESKNQYTACVIALSKFDKAIDKALDKASSKNSDQLSQNLILHEESTVQSTDSIIKPYKEETLKNKSERVSEFTAPALDDVLNFCFENNIESRIGEHFHSHYAAVNWIDGKNRKIINWEASFKNWVAREGNFSKKSKAAIAIDSNDDFIKKYGNLGKDASISVKIPGQTTYGKGKDIKPNPVSNESWTGFGSI